MIQPKLIHCLASAFLSLTSAFTAVRELVIAHGQTWLAVAGSLVALIAGAYSLRATYLTNKLRKIEIEQKQKNNKYGRHHTH